MIIAATDYRVGPRCEYPIWVMTVILSDALRIAFTPIRIICRAGWRETIGDWILAKAISAGRRSQGLVCYPTVKGPVG